MGVLRQKRHAAHPHSDYSDLPLHIPVSPSLFQIPALPSGLVTEPALQGHFDMNILPLINDAFRRASLAR